MKAPTGWKLVPLEPTAGMIQNGGHLNSEWLNDNAPIGESRYATPMRSVYAAMLAAAPEAPDVYAEKIELRNDGSQPEDARSDAKPAAADWGKLLPHQHIRDRANTIARECAKFRKPSYYAEPFEPHLWVIDAIVEAMEEGIKTAHTLVAAAPQEQAPPTRPLPEPAYPSVVVPGSRTRRPAYSVDQMRAALQTGSQEQAPVVDPENRLDEVTLIRLRGVMCLLDMETQSKYEPLAGHLFSLLATMRRNIEALKEKIKSSDANTEMYARAWQRELAAFDGTIRNKRHHIDAMVLTTQDLVALAKKNYAPKEHAPANKDAIRISELVDALQDVVTYWTSQFERNGHLAPNWVTKARAALRSQPDQETAP